MFLDETKPGYRDNSQKQYRGQLAARGKASRGCLTCCLRFSSLGGALARCADSLVHPDLNMVRRVARLRARRRQRSVPAIQDVHQLAHGFLAVARQQVQTQRLRRQPPLLARTRRVSVRMLLSTRVRPGRQRNS